MFGIVMDKTDAYMEILRLRNISQHDQLTGLYNASYLKKEGQKILDGNRSRVNALVFCDLDNRRINASIGLAFAQRESESMEDLINRADRAMYRVKRTEKNGIAIYDKSDEAGPV